MSQPKLKQQYAQAAINACPAQLEELFPKQQRNLLVVSDKFTLIARKGGSSCISSGVVQLEFIFTTDCGDAESMCKTFITEQLGISQENILYLKSEKFIGIGEQYQFPDSVTGQLQVIQVDPTSLDTLFESLELALKQLNVVDDTYLTPRPTLRECQLAVRSLFGDRGGALGCYTDD